MRSKTMGAWPGHGREWTHILTTPAGLHYLELLVDSFCWHGQLVMREIQACHQDLSPAEPFLAPQGQYLTLVTFSDIVLAPNTPRGNRGQGAEDISLVLRTPPTPAAAIPDRVNTPQQCNNTPRYLYDGTTMDIELFQSLPTKDDIRAMVPDLENQRSELQDVWGNLHT